MFDLQKREQKQKSFVIGDKRIAQHFLNQIYAVNTKGRRVVESKSRSFPICFASSLLLDANIPLGQSSVSVSVPGRRTELPGS